MKDFPVIRVALAGVVLAGAFLWNGWVDTSPANPVNPPAPSPVSEGPDMASVFNANPDKAEARAHAAEFAAICSKAALTLSFDAERGDKTRIKTGLDLAEYRNDLRWYTTDGWSFASKYPELKSVVAAWLDEQAGTDPKEMDDSTRRNWKHALEVLAANSQRASEVIR